MRRDRRARPRRVCRTSGRRPRRIDRSPPPGSTTTVLSTTSGEADVPCSTFSAPASASMSVRHRVRPVAASSALNSPAAPSTYNPAVIPGRRRARTVAARRTLEARIPRVRPQLASRREVVRRRQFAPAALLDRERPAVSDDERRVARRRPVASRAASTPVPSRFAPAAGGSGRPDRVRESSSNRSTSLTAGCRRLLGGWRRRGAAAEDPAAPAAGPARGLAALRGASRSQPPARLPIW